jgi:hypothetical protein
MTQDQAISVFRLARDGYTDYSRKVDTGEYAGIGKHDKFSALVALSSHLGARFPEAEADGYFHVHIPRYSTTP